METKDQIKQTLLKLLEQYPADDVTVKMFCIESGLSKQTLYNHYGNLMDALEDAYRSDFAAWLAGYDTYHEWVEGFRRVLELLHDKRDVYLHVYHSSRREDLLSMIDKYGRVLVLRGIDDARRIRGMQSAKRTKRSCCDST